MARIPDNELNSLKQDISLQRLIESQGIQLKKHGKDFIGLCPFHDDNDPSLVISPDKNLWHCLGACQTGGSVIDWVMKREGVSFKHAAELLRNDFSSLAAVSSTGSTNTQPPKRSRSQKLPSEFINNPDDHALLKRVIDYYHATLKQNSEALAYLEQRGLNHPEMIEHFKLGYANRSLGYRLPAKQNKEGAKVRTQLQTLGLYRKSGHEHFSGSLVIPVMGEHNIITDVYGRKIRNNLRKGTPLHLYLPGPHVGVFNIHCFSASKEIILCESLIDALTFWVAGFRNVTTSYGIEGFTEKHVSALTEHHVERVLIAYDRDTAGNTAAESLAEQLTQAGLDCFRLLFPKGMDANEYACQVTPATKSLGLVIRKAEWMGKGKTKTKTKTIPSITSMADDVLTEAEEVIEILSDENESLSPLVASVDLPDVPESTIASVIPDAPTNPADSIEANSTEREVTITLGDRHYRVRGLTKNTSVEQLKVNIMVRCGDHFHIDSLDLYSAKQRSSFIKQATNELGINSDIIKRDLGNVLLKCEALQDENIDETLSTEEKEIPLTVAEHQQALALLEDPNLLQRIKEDFHACGLVGEDINTTMGYLACVSRKLNKPLAILIQSTSAAGKSALMEAVLQFMPEDERVQYSAMTGQSLYYLGETDIKHKILAIAEEEGVAQASYALKLLQSEGTLTIASTGKDATTGNLVTQQYKVEGPVMLFLTTTAIDLDEELLNRCVVLTVNESREQTQAIQNRQRFDDTLEGLLSSQDRNTIFQLHRNAQRLLQPLKIVNPYARQLTFLDDQTRTRRDHQKYLTLIRTITLLHQYQREIKTLNHNDETVQYIEVTLDDIALANTLAHEVLGRTLDELPPQTRRLLALIHTMVTQACEQRDMSQADFHFSRKAVRDYTGMGNTQLKVHLRRLEDMEYILVHSGRRGQTMVYELLYQGEGEKGGTFLLGLLDVENLKKGKIPVYDSNKAGVKAKKAGQNTKKAGPSRPQVGGVSGPSRGSKNTINTTIEASSKETAKKSQKGTSRGEKKSTSYRSASSEQSVSSLAASSAK